MITIFGFEAEADSAVADKSRQDKKMMRGQSKALAVFLSVTIIISDVNIALPPYLIPNMRHVLLLEHEQDQHNYLLG